jgi:genome maintenance exonuclease 1
MPMTLIQQKYNYNALSRKETNGKRLYECPDGNRVPSVTTILSATKSQESMQALLNWRKAVGEKKAHDITVEAANRGTRMHKYLEDHLNGITLKESVSNPYAQQSLNMAKIVIANGLCKFNEFWGSEIPLYYPQLYAGTTDGIGVHEHEECIFDFKQTNKPKTEDRVEDYYIQLTAYALAHNKIHGTNIRKGVILMCSANLEYQEFILEPSKFDYWENIWWNKVEQYYSNC